MVFFQTEKSHIGVSRKDPRKHDEKLHVDAKTEREVTAELPADPPRTPTSYQVGSCPMGGDGTHN